MNYDYCSTVNNELVNAWDMFMDTGTVPAGFLRPDDYTSWIRCSHQKICGPIVNLTPEEIVKKQKLNRSLIASSDTVISSIDSILNRVIGSNYAVILMNAEGVIIELVYKGSDDIPLGDRCNELYACSNAINITSSEKKVLEVYGYEHLYPRAADWHTIGAPIFNIDKSVAGGLGVVCQTDNIPSIVPIVKIGSQLTQSIFNMEQINQYQISAMVEEIPEPVITVNENGIILTANQHFSNLLNIPVRQLLGQKITNYLRGNLDNNTLFSFFGGDDVISNVSIIGNNRSYKSAAIKKTIIGNLDFHPLVLLTFKNCRTRHLGLVPNNSHLFGDLIGNSTSMNEVKNIAQRASKSLSNILIEGESGTGKELLAQSIHKASRPQGPFIAINCGAIPSSLLQSELFGYEEGAFTGAKKGGNPGKFELADKGTLFLDEIGEMPLDMQVSLLRFIQDRTITPVGGSSKKKVDVRIIAATNRDLYKEVKKGNFREDLYYRLNVIEIKMPSLRERMGDIPILCEHILSSLSDQFNNGDPVRISTEALNYLCRYEWPGNVRELQNVLERALVFMEGNVITSCCLPSYLKESLSDMAEDNNGSLRDYEKMAIISALAKHQGNISKSAEELGIARSTLYQKMEKFAIPIR